MGDTRDEFWKAITVVPVSVRLIISQRTRVGFLYTRGNPDMIFPLTSYPFSYTVLPPSTPQICTDYLTIGALATEWAQLLITQLTVASPTTHQGSRRNDGAELVNVIASKGQPGHDIQEQLFLMDPTACPINLK